tara:strand:+ start:370 stop:834 length:465 start_codon:yes stop_codon:yes gene_type:complete
MKKGKLIKNQNKLGSFLSSKKVELREAYRVTKEHILWKEYTGYDKIEELSKTEKTMIGTLFELVVKKELSISQGNKLDCRLDDFEYDIKFTCRDNWMIPPECFGELCLLAKGNESSVMVGTLVASEENLNPGSNRDGKRTISAAGRKKIKWIVK